MKTQNKKKIIVSTLALAMGAALAGSISGSVAWYQYSTRAAAQIQGTSAGTIGELQIRGRQILETPASWSNGGKDNKVSLGKAKYKPMSYGLFDADNSGEAEDHYFHAPVYQTAQSIEYDIDNDELPYVEYELQFMFEHRGTNAEILSKNVYLTYFDIEKASDATYDFSPAVRVELIDENDERLAFLADESERVTDTHGQLDLNDNNAVDTTYWDCTDKQIEAVAAVPGTALGENDELAAGVDYYTRANKPEGSVAGYLNDGTYAYTKVDSVPAAPRAQNTYFPLTNLGSDALEPIEYVNKNGQTNQYTTDAHDAKIVDTADAGFNPYNIDTDANADKILVTTNDENTNDGWSSSLKVRIWLEGWELLGATPSASWKEALINQEFNVNMQFACSAVEQ